MVHYCGKKEVSPLMYANVFLLAGSKAPVRLNISSLVKDGDLVSLAFIIGWPSILPKSAGNSITSDTMLGLVYDF